MQPHILAGTDCRRAGATAAGAGHVPGDRGGADGAGVRHAQRQDGPLPGEHRDPLRRDTATPG